MSLPAAIRTAVRPAPFPRQLDYRLAGCGRCGRSSRTTSFPFGVRLFKWTRLFRTLHPLLPRRRAASGRFRLQRLDRLRCRRQHPPPATQPSRLLIGILVCRRNCFISSLGQVVVPMVCVLSLESYYAWILSRSTPSLTSMTATYLTMLCSTTSCVGYVQASSSQPSLELHAVRFQSLAFRSMEFQTAGHLSCVTSITLMACLACRRLIVAS